MKLKEINNRMVVEYRVLEEIPTFQQKMIQSGQIPEALPLIPCEINGILYYQYPLEREESIAKLAKENISTPWMRKVILAILDCMENRVEYLLGNGQLMLEPEWLFWYQDRIRIVIMPEGTVDEKKGMCRLIEFFMEEMDTEDREQVLFVYGLYRLLKNTDNLYQGLKDFLQVPPQSTPVVRPERNQMIRTVPPVETKVKQEGIASKFAKLFHRKKKESDILDWQDETVLLTPSMTIPTLVCVQSGEQIAMPTMPFLIGKNPERVDGVIEEPTVSRVHGKFYREQEKLYYMDQDSTNGTRINSVRVVPFESCLVQSGDHLQFGGIEYELA